MPVNCSLTIDSDDDPGAPRVELGRNWELLNFLFSGSPDPTDNVRGFLVSDFVELAPEAHQISAEDVAVIAAAIDDVGTDDLLSALEPQRLSEAGVYNAELVAEDPEGCARQLREQIEDLKRFLLAAAQGGHGVIRIIA